jgi:hypothetical protein
MFAAAHVSRARWAEVTVWLLWFFLEMRSLPCKLQMYKYPASFILIFGIESSFILFL